MPTKIFFSLMLFFLFSAKVQAFPHMTIEHDTIHDHFVVELIGKDWSMKESINVTRRHAENHPQ